LVGQPLHHDKYKICPIEFDVAVSTDDKLSGDAKAGIKVLGAGIQSEKKNSNNSRIKFILNIGVPPLE
jgi:hypothetical protein